MCQLMSLRNLPRFSLALMICLGSVGCGRPATEAECKEILRRTAELELSERLGDKDLVSTELSAIEQSMREPMMKKCVGKRITESVLACVRSAKTSEQLSKECFQ